MDVDGRWLTARDAARAIGKSERVVRSAIRRGDLVAYRLGGAGDPYSIAPEHLAAFIESRRCGDAAVVPAGSGGAVSSQGPCG